MTLSGCQQSYGESRKVKTSSNKRRKKFLTTTNKFQARTTYCNASDAQQLKDDFTTTDCQVFTQLAQVILVTAATDSSQVFLKFTDQHSTYMTQATVFAKTHQTLNSLIATNLFHWQTQWKHDCYVQVVYRHL